MEFNNAFAKSKAVYSVVRRGDAGIPCFILRFQALKFHIKVQFVYLCGIFWCVFDVVAALGRIKNMNFTFIDMAEGVFRETNVI